MIKIWTIHYTLFPCLLLFFIEWPICNSMIYLPIIYPISCLDSHKSSTNTIVTRYLFILSVCWSLSYRLLSCSYLNFISAILPLHEMTIFLYIIIYYHRNILLFSFFLPNSLEFSLQNYDKNMGYTFSMFLLDKNY